MGATWIGPEDLPVKDSILPEWLRALFAPGPCTMPPCIIFVPKEPEAE